MLTVFSLFPGRKEFGYGRLVIVPYEYWHRREYHIPAGHVSSLESFFFTIIMCTLDARSDRLCLLSILIQDSQPFE